MELFVPIIACSVLTIRSGSYVSWGFGAVFDEYYGGLNANVGTQHILYLP